MAMDFENKVIRESAILTNSYVASDARGLNDSLVLTDKNQVILLVDFTKGSLTSMEMKVDFSHDGITYFQETSINISGGTGTVSLFEYTFTATGKYRIAIPIKDKFIRASVKGTGTVTSSLCEITTITWIA